VHIKYDHGYYGSSVYTNIVQSPLYPFAIKIKDPQIEIFAKKFGSSLICLYV
jgi:hypothetical protein